MFNSPEEALADCQQQDTGEKKCPNGNCQADRDLNDPISGRFMWRIIYQQCEDNVAMGSCNPTNAATPGWGHDFTPFEFCNGDDCGPGFNPTP